MYAKKLDELKRLVVQAVEAEDHIRPSNEQDFSFSAQLITEVSDATGIMIGAGNESAPLKQFLGGHSISLSGGYSTLSLGIQHSNQVRGNVLSGTYWKNAATNEERCKPENNPVWPVTEDGAWEAVTWFLSHIGPFVRGRVVAELSGTD